MTSNAVSSDKCANCGHPEGEHHYNGACYGLCGRFVPREENVKPRHDCLSCARLGRKVCGCTYPKPPMRPVKK